MDWSATDEIALVCTQLLKGRTNCLATYTELEDLVDSMRMYVRKHTDSQV